jgi:hypothetical protein
MKGRHDVTVGMPDATTRWRCAQCGNLTRFDLTRIRRTHDYIHVDLAGQQQVEESRVLEEQIVELRCRWCGSDRVELTPRPA